MIVQSIEEMVAEMKAHFDDGLRVHLEEFDRWMEIHTYPYLDELEGFLLDITSNMEARWTKFIDEQRRTGILQNKTEEEIKTDGPYGLGYYLPEVKVVSS